VSARNLWPAGLALFLALFFAGVVSFVAFSMTQPVDLVSPTYYQEAVDYQGQLDRERLAWGAAATPAVSLDPHRSVAWLTFPGGAALPERGEVTLYRPADAALDRRLPLVLDGAHAQRIDVSALAPGLWRVRVRWQARGRDYASEAELVLR
jgi:hypothetical protein